MRSCPRSQCPVMTLGRRHRSSVGDTAKPAPLVTTARTAHAHPRYAASEVTRKHPHSADRFPRSRPGQLPLEWLGEVVLRPRGVRGPSEPEAFAYGSPPSSPLFRRRHGKAGTVGDDRTNSTRPPPDRRPRRCPKAPAFPFSPPARNPSPRLTRGSGSAVTRQSLVQRRVSGALAAG